MTKKLWEIKIGNKEGDVWERYSVIASSFDQAYKKALKKIREEMEGLRLGVIGITFISEIES